MRVHRADSVDDALAVLASGQPDAALYAGGVELVPLLKHDPQPNRCLVDVKRIADLHTLDLRGGVLRVGSAVTHQRLARDPVVLHRLPGLSRAARGLGNVRVRGTGTIGGNVCFARPQSDLCAGFAALDARFQVRGPESTRSISADAFWPAAYRCALRHDEMLVGIDVPVPTDRQGFGYRRWPEHGWPLAAVAARLTLDDHGGAIEDARIIVGCATSVPRRIHATERMLAGADVKAGVELHGAAYLADDVDLESEEASAEYRAHLLAVLTRRALSAAMDDARARGKAGHVR